MLKDIEGEGVTILLGADSLNILINTLIIDLNDFSIFFDCSILFIS